MPPPPSAVPTSRVILFTPRIRHRPSRRGQTKAWAWQNFTPTDTTDYTTANGSGHITVIQATPVITWANPTSITYGTALSATQLDATAAFGGSGVAGNFVYTPASGTVLHAGTNQSLGVVFTPTDTTDYTNANASAQITVTQATPVITWSNPANITYGTALSATQLDATAAFGGSSVAGNFVYTPAAGTVLNPGANQTLGVVFTPTDTTDFINANASAQINVTSAIASVSGNANSIADGESSPSAVNFTNFGSVVQNGSAVTETYSITNNGNATLVIPTSPGNQISVPAGFTFTQPLLTSLTPGVSTTFTVTLTTGTAGVFSGNVSIPTNDPTNDPYQFEITGTVTSPVASTPVIAWANPANIAYGTALSATQLDATASYNGSNVPGTFVYTPAAGTVLHAGANQTLGVVFTPTDTIDYTNANGSAHITVTQDTPVITWANPANITYGTALSATQLDATAAFGGSNVAGGFVYTPAAGTVLHAGANQSLGVVFTPTDTTDYTTANASAQITVTQATPAITWANPANITYGTALSATQLDATAAFGGSGVAGNFVYTPASGTVLHAGPANRGALGVVFTPARTPPTTPTPTVPPKSRYGHPSHAGAITWANPANIIYGTALSATQLDATAAFGGSGVAGNFVYTPASGTILHAGTNQSLGVVFTPTDTTDYANANASAQITVTQATPVITWANPANITYGTALSATQLDATAAFGGSGVAGNFVYTPASGTVLHAGANQSLGVVFTPTDTTDYANANGSAQITVTQATPAITWANPANIIYGTALSATQLDATAAFGGSGVAGNFVYTPASGTILHAGTNQSLGVVFTPTDTTDYANANASAQITVTQATPVITWANPANITYGTALSATQLDATAAFGGSGVAGNFVYTPAAGTVLHAGANQSLGVVFTPTDTTDYTNANGSAHITVTQATPVITWANPANITYGTVLSATQLDATAAFGGFQRRGRELRLHLSRRHRSSMLAPNQSSGRRLPPRPIPPTTPTPTAQAQIYGDRKTPGDHLGQSREHHLRHRS